MVEVKGKGVIVARIILDSINANGNRMTTYEVEYPRFILAEVNTHCMLEKNSASSRAIPVGTMLDMIELSPAMPVSWGQNNPGMQSKTLMDSVREADAIKVWMDAAKAAIGFSRIMSDPDGINGHKQLANRLGEPFQTMKSVISGTEWENFFWLRDHEDADPTFRELARVMNECRRKSVPTLLKPGQWHLPYVARVDDRYFSGDVEIPLDVAKKISASCSAQVSYRKLNDSIEQAQKVFGMLNLESEEKPAHASPICHQATPMNESNISFNPDTWEDGITHVRRNGSLWSGKLQGWIQFRQLFKNEAKW